MSTSSADPRVVIKIGTSSLVDGGEPAGVRADGLVDTVVRLHAEGLRPVLVTSGAIALGRAAMAGRVPARDAERQVAAAMGQTLLAEALRSRLADRGLLSAQFLLTPLDLCRPPHSDSVTRALEETLDAGLVPVVNENDAVMVRNNDVLAALLGGALNARLLLILTDVPGVYDADPRIRPQARRIPVLAAMSTEVERLAAEAAAGPGSGGMTAKLCAAWIATRAGVTTVIASADEPDVALRAVRGEDVGTRIHAQPRPGRPDLHRLWRAFSQPPRGLLLCDRSAESSVVSGEPLTLRQIRDVRGEPASGTVVDVVTERSGVIARGRTRVPVPLLRPGVAGDRAADETVLDQHSYVSLMEVH
nr:gamma-glutamyl kinase [bacterium]